MASASGYHTSPPRLYRQPAVVRNCVMGKFNNAAFRHVAMRLRTGIVVRPTTGYNRSAQLSGKPTGNQNVRGNWGGQVPQAAFQLLLNRGLAVVRIINPEPGWGNQLVEAAGMGKGTGGSPSPLIWSGARMAGFQFQSLNNGLKPGNQSRTSNNVAMLTVGGNLGNVVMPQQQAFAIPTAA